MASPSRKSIKRDSFPSNQASRDAAPRSSAPQEVSPAWLIRALGLTLLAALVCGYLTVCLLFYQGQWQLILHPSRAKAAPAAIAGDPIQTVRFGVDESGTPQLAGRYLPARSTASGSSRYDAYTVLYLPSGDGSLADAVPTLAALHNLGLNLFAFDYRGYGESSATHPNQQRMTQDAASAWQYLTVSRAVSPGRIILFGSGVGGFLAAQLAGQHGEVPAIVLDSPRADIVETVLADPRTSSLPVRALLHDRFDVKAAVSALKTPKLFLLDAGDSAQGISGLIEGAASPKVTAHLKSPDWSGPVYAEQISRFLDEYAR